MPIPDKLALVGSDDEFMADRQAEEWFQQLKQSFAEEVEIIDGRAQTVAEVEQSIALFSQAVSNLSLFGDKKIVWFRQITFLGDNATARTQGAKEAVADLTKLLERFEDPNTYVLLSASPLDRRKALPKLMDGKNSLHYLASEKNGEHLRSIIANTCSELGIKIDDEAAQTLIERVSGNTRMLVNEIHKLATYVLSEPEPVIRYGLVNEMVSQFGDTEFFEMADAFYETNLGKALHSVRKHFFTHREARPLLANLQNRNRLLIQLRSLQEGRLIPPGRSSVSASDLARVKDTYGSWFADAEHKSEFHPFGQNPWYLSRLVALANRISLKALIDIQLAFVDAFSSLTDHPNEQEMVIRNLVIDCHKLIRST